MDLTRHLREYQVLLPGDAMQEQELELQAPPEGDHRGRLIEVVIAFPKKITTYHDLPSGNLT